MEMQFENNPPVSSFENPKDAIVKACLEKNISPDDLAEFLYKLREDFISKSPEELTSIHKELLETYGLPWEVERGRAMLYDVTMTNEKGSDDSEAAFNLEIPQYFGTLAYLESLHPGSVKFLFEEYGIRAFHRYGADILAWQYENTNKDVPYGIVLTSYRDDGDGFTRLHEELGDIIDQLPTGVTLRILEAKNAVEVVRRLVKQKKHFPDQPFVFGLVATHSHGGGHIVLSADHNDDPITGLPGAIRQEHLEGSGARRIGDYFAENAPIILMGCQSGRQEGIAERLAETLNRPIIATTENTTSLQVDFTSWNDVLVPEVDAKYFWNDSLLPTRVISSPPQKH